MLFTFLIGTFFLATLIQVYFWVGFFSKLAHYNPPPFQQTNTKPVSVIICARNEAQNLAAYLPKILEQNYPKFEVIVVNDHSSDNSEQIILEIQKNYPNLHLINESNKKLPGKKGALTLGIQAASYEQLLLTDADCFPSSNLWILSMMQLLQEDQVVLGYSPYLSENSFLNLFIRYETTYVATQYFSFALAGQPYMGVGRNLAYTKTLFKKHDGFEKHMHLASGDDDLFINKAANALNTKINIHTDAFMYSVPKSNWKSYYNQKRRHLSTAINYNRRHQILLGLLAWSHMWHYWGAILLGLLRPDVLLILGISYLVRIGVVSYTLWHIMRKLQTTELRPWIFLLDFSYSLYYLLFAPVLLITGSNNRTWT